MEFLESFSTKINYWIYIIIMMIGLYAMIAKNNLIKKLIGMSVFQTAIILFYVSIGVKEGATIPILYHDQVHPEHHGAHGDHGAEHADDAHHASVVQEAVEAHAREYAHASKDTHMPEVIIEGSDFANPLPHVLMLTAIVVGVATLGVGLAVTQKLYREYGSIEESEILELIKSGK